MRAEEVETTFDRCERELDAGGRVDLAATGFWRAVREVKRHPELVERYAGRIGAIDRRAFRGQVRLVLPARLGLVLLLAGAVAGLALFVAAFALSPGWAGVAILLGTAALDVATHGLAHVVVGEIGGIHFTDWFVDLPRRPQPGFKIDYGSYLRASPRERAWMHASGAIVTKVVPFAAIPVAYAVHAPWWTGALLLAVGALQLASDAIFSVKASDWKKFRREMRIAREDGVPSSS